MSKDEVVTHEQLEKILKGFEKIGVIAKEIRFYDKQLKDWIIETNDRKGLETQKGLIEKLNILNEQFDKRFKTMLLQEHNNLNTEIDSRVKNVVEKSAAETSAMILDAMKTRFGEIKTYTQNLIETKVEKVEEKLTADAMTLKAAIRADVEMSEEKLLQDVEEILKKNIQSIENSMKQMFINALAEETNFVRDTVKKFTEDLGDILSEKVIDKAAIEEKISEIQSNLARKTQSVINFNVEQARQQMEYAAQAEIKDGLKEASAQIFGAISAN